MTRARGMIRDYSQDVRLFKSRTRYGLFAVLLLVYLFLPLEVDDTWSNIFVLAGITAIGGLGLNLLTGYTGLPSLGTAAFIAIGGFCASYLGRADTSGGLDWPFWAYTLVAILFGCLVGLIIGLPALRLRGVYLSIATLGLVFVTLYVLKSWEEISGGNAGAPTPANVNFLGSDFWTSGNVLSGGGLDAVKNSVTIFDHPFTRNESLMYLVWAFVGLVALLCTNVVRSRPGRALQAVRDRDVAAEVVGVSLFRTKVGAFVISSGIAALAGVFFGLYIQYVTPTDSNFGLNLSIQYLAVIVVGGIGTTYVPILGALVIAMIPQIISWLSDLFPFLFTSSPSEVGFTQGNFAALLYALLIIVFLIREPNGVAGLLRRFGGYFRSWPLAAGRRSTF
jgi:branched-chain amino acid transport system permease protein